MKRYIALLLSLEDKKPYVFTMVDENDELVYIKTEKEAEEYLCKYYNDFTVLYGLVDAPNKYHRKIRDKIYGKGK